MVAPVLPEGQGEAVEKKRSFWRRDRNKKPFEACLLVVGKESLAPEAVGREVSMLSRLGDFSVAATLVVPVATFEAALMSKATVPLLKAAIRAVDDDVLCNAVDGLREALQKLEIPADLDSDLRRFLGKKFCVMVSTSSETKKNFESRVCRALDEVYDALREAWASALSFDDTRCYRLASKSEENEDVVKTAFRMGFLKPVSIVAQKKKERRSSSIISGKLYTLNPKTLSKNEWLIETTIDDISIFSCAIDLAETKKRGLQKDVVVLRQETIAPKQFKRILTRRTLRALFDLGEAVVARADTDAPLCVDFASRNATAFEVTSAFEVKSVVRLEIDDLRAALAGRVSDREEYDDDDSFFSWGGAIDESVWLRRLRSSTLSPLEEKAFVDDANRGFQEALGAYGLRLNENAPFRVVNGVIYGRSLDVSLRWRIKTKQSYAEAEEWRLSVARRRQERLHLQQSFDLADATDEELLEQVSTLARDARDDEQLKQKFALAWMIPLGRCVSLFSSKMVTKKNRRRSAAVFPERDASKSRSSASTGGKDDNKNAGAQKKMLLMLAAAMETRREAWALSVERRLQKVFGPSFDATSPEKEALTATFEALVSDKKGVISDDGLARERLRSLSALPGDAGRSVRDFIDAKGSFLCGDTLAAPTLQERPAMLLGLLRRCVSAEAPPKDATFFDAELFSCFFRKRDWPVLLDALNDARASYRVRAETILNPFWGLLRLALLEVGRRIVCRRGLEEPEDFVLWVESYEDVEKILVSKKNDDHLFEAIAREASARRLRAKRMSVSDEAPPLLGGKKTVKQQHKVIPSSLSMKSALVVAQEHLEASGEYRSLNTVAKRRLLGIVASRGSRRGRVRLVLRHADVCSLRPSDIAVLRSESLAPLCCGLAAAIVCDEGTVFGTAALCARAQSIPCVVSAAGASSLLRNGDQIYISNSPEAVILRLDVEDENDDTLFEDHAPAKQNIARVNDQLIMDIDGTSQVLVHSIEDGSNGFLVTLPPDGKLRIPLRFEPDYDTTSDATTPLNTARFFHQDNDTTYWANDSWRSLPEENDDDDNDDPGD